MKVPYTAVRAVVGRKQPAFDSSASSIRYKRSPRRQRILDLRVIPAAAVLILEQNEIPGCIEPGLSPRIVKQHEREQRRRFGRRLRSHRSSHESSEPDGLGAEVSPHEIFVRVAA
jgi:hypothetical protein